MGQEEYKKPKFYFNNEQDIDIAIANNIQKNEKVTLLLSLQKCLENTYYKIKICSFNKSKNETLFETSKLKPDKNNIVEFKTSYSISYFFEKEQKLIFKIEINDQIIDYETTLGCIIGSKKNTLCQNICNEREEKITIQATKRDESNKNKLKIHFLINKEKKSKKFIKDKFLFIITSESQDLYRSEIISNDGYLQPVTIPIFYLIPKFKITFYNIKKEVLTSFSDLTYEKFLNMNDNIYPLNFKSKKCDLIIKSEIIRNTKTFLDYIKEDMKIKLAIAIDFSKSNQDLHKINTNKMNRFEEVIRHCGDIISCYDNEQLCPVWGLGANNIPEKFNRMCFPINFKDNPNIKKIDGVLKEYRNCLNKISFSESVEFSPVIRQFIKRIEDDKEHINKYYNILLLLTDGKYADKEKIIDAIVKASKLPMSIIMVGLQDIIKQNGEEFDIVYMIDATGSMGNYLKVVKDQCINISNELQKKFKDFNFKFGGVFYRDPIDCPNEKNEMIDLNDDILSLKFFISCLKPIGGGDEAEDWAGGYELAINHIKWRNGQRLIIHICDADSHGKEYTQSEDHHPDEEVKIPPLIKKCVEKQIKVIGFNINKGANTSFQQYKKLYDLIDVNKKGLYKIKDFEETENLAETFKESVIEAATFVAMMDIGRDNEPLTSSKGEKWERDNIQFVSYDKFKNNPQLLAEKILEKIPSQLVQYYNNQVIKDAKNDGFFIMEDIEIMDV